MNYTLSIVFCLFLMFLAIGSSMSENVSHEEYENFTNKLDYDDLNLSVFNDIGNDKNESFISRGISKYADFMMFFAIEGGKEVIDYGYNNPRNYKGWMIFIVIIMCASLIIPILYLITFIFIAIKELYNLIKRKKTKANTEGKENENS